MLLSDSGTVTVTGLVLCVLCLVITLSMRHLVWLRNQSCDSTCKNYQDSLFFLVVNVENLVLIRQPYVSLCLRIMSTSGLKDTFSKHVVFPKSAKGSQYCQNANYDLFSSIKQTHVSILSHVDNS